MEFLSGQKSGVLQFGDYMDTVVLPILPIRTQKKYGIQAYASIYGYLIE